MIGERDQLELLPSRPPETRRARLPLADVTGYENAQPRQALVESIGQIGVLEPVVVTDRPEGSYRVIDGKRRVKALQLLDEADRLAGPGEIEAVIISGRDPYTDLARAGMALALHGTRSSSPASELHAIEQILESWDDEAATISRIARATGMPVGTVKRRLKLRGLSPALRAAFDRGAITATIAEAATRLSSEQQRELEPMLGDGQRITLANVVEVARRRTAEAAATLDDQLFGEHRQASWRSTVRGHLRAALDAIPAEDRDGEIAQAIASALERAERTPAAQPTPPAESRP